MTIEDEYQSDLTFRQDDLVQVEGYRHSTIVASTPYPLKCTISSRAVDLISGGCGMRISGGFIEFGCPHAATYRISYTTASGDLLCDKVWEAKN